MSEQRAEISLPLFRPQAKDHASGPQGASGAPRRLSILGATGSIGDSTLAVVTEHREKFAIDSLVGGKNVERMVALIDSLQPAFVAMADQEAAKALSALRPDVEIGGGRQAVLEASARPVDICVAAITGFAGLEPLLNAIQAGNDIALANKEAMVCAGPFVLAQAKKAQVNILPIDSEHSALFQCLMGQDLSAVDSLVLTASGGPFRALPATELIGVTVEQALAHPNWSMGNKLTIDSATLMNKGLELIEARWLFSVSPSCLSAVIHPGSIVHSMVQYCDGSIIAQMGEPTMVTPISLALGFPNRLPMAHHGAKGAARRADPVAALAGWQNLRFETIDHDRFPCFSLAKQAMAQGLGACIVLNAANELAVDAFLNGRIAFADIAAYVQRALSAYDASNPGNPSLLEDVFELDSWTRAKGAKGAEGFGSA